MNRFINAQNKIYSKALSEIKKGKKKTHWMWYIFPQIHGLGSSDIAIKYELKSMSEAKEYISNELLKNRLLEISTAIYELNGDIEEILGYPDFYKFKSCMTLFYLIAPEYPIFYKNIERYFKGKLCEHTLKIFNDEKHIKQS